MKMLDNSVWRRGAIPFTGRPITGKLQWRSRRIDTVPAELETEIDHHDFGEDIDIERDDVMSMIYRVPIKYEDLDATNYLQIRENSYVAESIKRNIYKYLCSRWNSNNDISLRIRFRGHSSEKGVMGVVFLQFFTTSPVIYNILYL
jgi:hypothetical protein